MRWQASSGLRGSFALDWVAGITGIRSYAVLVTRQMHWEAKRIVRAYCGRFQIEVCYKDIKGRVPIFPVKR